MCRVETARRVYHADGWGANEGRGGSRARGEVGKKGVREVEGGHTATDHRVVGGLECGVESMGRGVELMTGRTQSRTGPACWLTCGLGKEGSTGG